MYHDEALDLNKGIDPNEADEWGLDDADSKVDGGADTKESKGGHDTQSRDWMLTIRAEGHMENEIKALFEKIGAGAVFQRETGADTGYEHFQCFLQVKTPMRFSTLKNHLTNAGFRDAHIERRRKSVADCVAYCTKSETQAGQPVYVGKINMKDKRGQRSDLIGLREQILDGMSMQEVLLGDSGAKAAHCTRWLGELEEAYVRKELGGKLRDIDAHYLYGAPGVGKTRFVYDRYPIEDIYRVTNYKHPFDEYGRHKVLVLDEYDSQLPWEQLLNYLDRYPVVLPARYHNHQACFTAVWIISNLPLAAQYPDIVGERRLALMRRLADCNYMTPEGELIKEPLPGRQEGGSP